LCLWWDLKNVRPEPLPNKITKDEDNKQKPIGVCPARTTAAMLLKLKLTTSSHHSTKPHVSRSLFVPRQKANGLKKVKTLKIK
jgi:hypothetical protein